MQDFGSGDTSSNLVGGMPSIILAICAHILKIRHKITLFSRIMMLYAYLFYQEMRSGRTCRKTGTSHFCTVLPNPSPCPVAGLPDSYPKYLDVLKRNSLLPQFLKNLSELGIQNSITNPDHCIRTGEIPLILRFKNACCCIYEYEVMLGVANPDFNQIMKQLPEYHHPGCRRRFEKRNLDKGNPDKSFLRKFPVSTD